MSVPWPGYNPGFAPTGWVCPKCGRVYSPDFPMCSYCVPGRTITTPDTRPQCGCPIGHEHGCSSSGCPRRVVA